MSRVLWSHTAGNVASKIPGATGIRVQTTSKTQDIMGENWDREPVMPTASKGLMERAMGIEPNAERG